MSREPESPLNGRKNHYYFRIRSAGNVGRMYIVLDKNAFDDSQASREAHNVKRIVIIMVEYSVRKRFLEGSLSVVAKIPMHGLNTIEAMTVLLKIKIAGKK